MGVEEQATGVIACVILAEARIDKGEIDVGVLRSGGTDGICEVEAHADDQVAAGVNH